LAHAEPISPGALTELARHKIGTFAHLIHRHALLRPTDQAFSCGEEVLTYAEFNARANRLVSSLRRAGVKKGEVLGVLSWNSLGHVCVYGAAMKGGFVFSPFNPRLKAEELSHLIDYSGCTTLFVGADLVERVLEIRGRLPALQHLVALDEPVAEMLPLADLVREGDSTEPEVEVREDDPLHLIYTSGTTGRPRGALYTHRQAWDDCRTLAFNMSARAEDRHLQISPLFHIAGNTGLRTFLFAGARNTIVSSFDAAATLRTIEEQKITHIMIVPTHLIMMLEVPDLQSYDLSSLELIWYGASAMPIEALRRGIAALGPIFAQGYGQTESGPAISHLSREEHVRFLAAGDQERLRSVGQPDIGVQVRILDPAGVDLGPGEVGEIVVRSAHVMHQYWQEPDASREALAGGWLRTGDMGRYDELGYLYIVDRKKDMIISGGENVYGREVEDVLRAHPCVAEVAVIGVPDELWVEKVHAVVVLHPGKSVLAETLALFCKERLAGYKVPKSVEFVEQLPKNATGKVLKTELRARRS
jgi:long-chain acyl-CoA synthetase